MHEMAITQSIMSIALEQAQANQAKRISRIDLAIGEMTGIVDECVEFYFGFLSKDTIAAGARLVFEHPPVKLRCRKCGMTFSPAPTAWSCPGCGESGAEIISGRECSVTSIEVE